jgi:thiol-disulfide isomerase/thioredoxin
MKVKILLVITSVFLVPRLSTAQINKGFTINGEISGLTPGTVVYLTTNADNKTDTIGRCKTKNYKFHFSGRVKGGADWYFLWVDGNKKYTVLLLDNSNVKIKGDLNDWPKVTIVGSPSHAEMSWFTDRVNPLLNELDNLQKQRLPTVKVSAKIDSLYLAFINAHPNSMYSPFLAINGNFSLEQKRTAYSNMTEDAKNSRFGKELKDNVDNLELSSKIKIGKIAPDFVSSMPDGKQISFLKTVKGSKYTLVDFWASWCAPCRKHTPDIIKVYEAFHDKGFNVLGVSLDFSAKEWGDAIIKDDIPWPQVSQLKGRNEQASRLFGLNGIPAYVLVDQDGKIIEMDLPGAKVPSDVESLRGDKLWKLIESLLGKPKQTN